MSRPAPPHLLVLGHDATRTGAPRLLLSLLEWAAGQLGVTADVVLRRGGPLLDAMRSVADVQALRPWGHRGVVDVVEAAIARSGAAGLAARVPSAEVRLRRPRRRHPADLTVVNGLGGAALLDVAPPHVPVVALVHELDIGMGRAAGAADRSRLWARAERIVVVSEAVADLMRRQPHVQPDRVVVAFGFVDEHRGSIAATAGDDPVERRQALGLPQAQRPLVGAVGTGQWRKGIDLFIQLAVVMSRKATPGPRFAWVGPLDDEEAVRHDLDRAGIADDVILTGAVDDTSPWYPAFDIMVSTSREDPFPLVGLEAGLAARPVVSFDNGGLRELLAHGRGAVVPPLAVDAMAEEIAALLADPVRARQVGRCLREHVEQEHVTAVGAPRMWQALVGPRGGPGGSPRS